MSRFSDLPFDSPRNGPPDEPDEGRGTTDPEPSYLCLCGQTFPSNLARAAHRPSCSSGRVTTGWSYGHNPRAWTQVRHCGCEDCTAWFAEYDAALAVEVSPPARKPT